MSGSKSTTWVVGTVVLALVLLAAGWFLLVGPVLTTAGETRAQAEEVRASNDQLQSKIVTLKKQFEQLPEFQQQLAQLQQKVPTTGDIAGYLRQIDAEAGARGVTLTTITPSSGELFSPQAPAAEPAADSGAAPEDGATTDATATDEGTDGAAEGAVAAEAATTDTAPAAAGPVLPVVAAPAGMIDVPITITALGSYDNVMGWLEAVQQTVPRLQLVTSLNGVSQKDAEASGGRPATTVGDLELTVTGYLYVLPGTPAVVPADTPEESLADLPPAIPGKNPLVPVG
ncbi:type 4a pilus biogenesis protein PilO [Cellulosimicrobium cellulans]|uniref:type 4a pilus biogenesis protein PilO n=1 Tax=Cellulosimicrobium cellulans TaxID=1710 RepID=UPI00130DF3FC|nr:type 4a pilus biogenesis protein PilO [Cellulosimicrobium cellulans]